jgi:hypothetical protein
MVIGALFMTGIALPSQAEALYAYYSKVDSGEDWELHSLTGDHADVVVHVGDAGELIFWRASSYLPYWKTAGDRLYLDELVPRSGDGPEGRPDRINQYSYVRIIENGPEKVVVHWRYVPDFKAKPDLSVARPDFGKVGFDGVVHETFTITPDGAVTRTVRRGKAKLDDFRDAGNVTVQTLQLSGEGVEQRSLTRAALSGAAPEAIEGAPVRTGTTEAPTLHFTFDEGLRPDGDLARDAVSGAAAVVHGNKSVWKRGVSGTALGFDGYASKVVLPRDDAPEPIGELTVEAWVAPGAYSVCKWSGIVLQSTWEALVNDNFRFDNIDWGERQLGEKIVDGYFLGIDEFGHAGFMAVIDGETVGVSSEEALDLHEWAHVAAVLGDGHVTLYVNGVAVDQRGASGRLTPSDGDLFVGMNDDRIEYVPKHSVRPFSTFPSALGFEGLIDEVKVYTRALPYDEIWRSYEAHKPARLVAEMDPRVLPGQPADIPQEFGAYYTNLKYHDLWDNMWRTSDWPDVVVKFDDMPTSVVFWRGTTYGANYVTENNHWIGDQSIELTDWHWDDKPTGTNTTCEHMMDRQCRFGHVRIIENTDARVVIHWRYASCDANYKHPNWDRTNGWGVWTDEYYTIYPDGTSIRHVDSNGATDYYFDPPTSIHFSAVQLFFQAGTTPKDTLEDRAVTLANFDGDTAHADLASGKLDREIEGAHIETINLKSEYKVFLAFKPLPEGERWGGGWQLESEFGDPEETDIAQAMWDTEVKPWAEYWRAVGLEPEWGEGVEEGNFVDDSNLLIGPWNHWPGSQFLSDGRNITAADRFSSAEMTVGAGGDRRSEVMYGLTNQDITTLIPRVKAWSFPAKVTNSGRVRNQGFDQGQCAYVFTALSDSFYFTLKGSEETPIYNPSFVIKNWRKAEASARVTIDEEELEPGRDFRQGTFYDIDGTVTCVIWLRYDATEPRTFAVSQE